MTVLKNEKDVIFQRENVKPFAPSSHSAGIKMI